MFSESKALSTPPMHSPAIVANFGCISDFCFVFRSLVLKLCRTATVQHCGRRLRRVVVSIIEFDKPNSGNRTEVTELTDVLKIDGSREIYKEYSITSLFRKNTTNNSGVAVTNERITASQDMRVEYSNSKDKKGSHFDNYTIAIDRVSGVFEEVLTEGGIGSAKSDSFKIETNGTCKKAEKKF